MDKASRMSLAALEMYEISQGPNPAYTTILSEHGPGALLGGMLNLFHMAIQGWAESGGFSEEEILEALEYHLNE